jgi:uncharacterized protein
MSDMHVNMNYYFIFTCISDISMIKYKRLLHVPETDHHSYFLWGPRGSGKSTWLKDAFPDAIKIDLLKSDVFSEYKARPYLLRERYSEISVPGPLVIDEIQKCPELLDEVHWLIENASRTFILTGSSARKLKSVSANLLGGRARRREMRPLCFPEIGTIDIDKALISGLLPRNYLSKNPIEDLRAYVGDYLKEEIASEAVSRNLAAFSEFLRIAAITNGEILNYANISRESGISAKVVKSYFDILEDTLLGYRIYPWTRSEKRRLRESPKFYFFDSGVTNYLSKRKPQKGTPEYGHSFEQFILMELMAYKSYRSPEMEIKFWETSSGNEVDFIINDMELAIEVKSGTRVHAKDFKNLGLLKEEYTIKHQCIVCDETEPRISNGVRVYPWKVFLEKLWADELVAM